MKLYNKLFLMVIGCATLNSCSDMDNIDSEGFRITDGQIEDTNELIPSRVESSLVGTITCPVATARRSRQ